MTFSKVSPTSICLIWVSYAGKRHHPCALSNGTIKRDTDRAKNPRSTRKTIFSVFLGAFPKVFIGRAYHSWPTLKHMTTPQNQQKCSRTSESWANEVRSPWIDILSRPTFCAIRGMRFWSIDRYFIRNPRQFWEIDVQDWASVWKLNRWCSRDWRCLR